MSLEIHESTLLIVAAEPNAMHPHSYRVHFKLYNHGIDTDLALIFFFFTYSSRPSIYDYFSDFF